MLKHTQKTTGENAMETAFAGGSHDPNGEFAAKIAAADAHETDETGYYRIGELAKEFNLSLRTLRFYEDRGLLHPVRAGSSRLFTQRDRARLVLIMLGRKVGFSLREVKHMLDLYSHDESNVQQHQYVLDKSTAQLKRLKRQRDELTKAIDTLQDGMIEVRRRLAAGET